MGFGTGWVGHGKGREWKESGTGNGIIPLLRRDFSHKLDTPYLRRLCVESDEKEEGQNLSASFNVAMKMGMMSCQKDKHVSCRFTHSVQTGL